MNRYKIMLYDTIIKTTTIVLLWYYNDVILIRKMRMMTKYKVPSKCQLVFVWMQMTTDNMHRKDEMWKTDSIHVRISGLGPNTHFLIKYNSAKSNKLLFQHFTVGEFSQCCLPTTERHSVLTLEPLRLCEAILCPVLGIKIYVYLVVFANIFK